jgi:hypothetical protein
MKSLTEKTIDDKVNERISKLLGFVDEKSIVTIDKTKGLVFIGGERVDEGRLMNLKTESEFFMNSELWKVLNETIRYMAYDTAFVKSTKWEDVLSSKMWLYHLDIQKKLMETFKSYKKK